MRPNALPVCRPTVLLALAAVLFAAAGCGSKPTLTVYCAAGVHAPVEQLAAEFSRRENVQVVPISSGSGVLLSQMQLAARGDVYVAGDDFFMQQAVDKGLVAKPTTLAWWVAVIGVPKGNPKNVKGIEDLAREDVRVGLADPKAAAAGRAAAAMLAKAGLSSKVKPVVMTLTVNELGNHLKLGTLDAAIVWDAIVKQYKVDAAPIDARWRESVAIPAGVLKFTKDAALAAKFISFLAGEDGHRAFEENGYTVTLEKEAAK